MDISQQVYEKLENCFIQADVYGAINIMKEIPEMSDLVREYLNIFEKEQYIRYEVPEEMNRILLCYQKYYRDVFYLHLDVQKSEALLFERLKNEMGLHDADLIAVEDEMKRVFNLNGYHILTGKTNGFRGPYVWKDTIPVTYEVELPEITSTYRINMLKGFVCRSWMDYLTFGEKGTGGWTSPDGTINCVEKAYDVQSERFTVSLLKHEAQHSEDFKRWPGIESCDLEYRAKLVELIYTNGPGLLEKYIRESNADNSFDGHAIAAARIKREMSDLVNGEISMIRARAKELFVSSTEEMNQKYGPDHS